MKTFMDYTNDDARIDALCQPDEHQQDDDEGEQIYDLPIHLTDYVPANKNEYKCVF
jgi:hypothetical protein